MLFWGLSVPGEVPWCSASVLALLAGFLNSALSDLKRPQLALISSKRKGGYKHHPLTENLDFSTSELPFYLSQVHCGNPINFKNTLYQIPKSHFFSSNNLNENTRLISIVSKPIKLYYGSFSLKILGPNILVPK